MQKISMDSSVEFLYRAAAQRDPNKRRVKPVEKHLIQVDFGMDDDDSADSDYNQSENGASADDDDDNDRERTEISCGLDHRGSAARRTSSDDEIDVERVEESGEGERNDNDESSEEESGDEDYDDDDDDQASSSGGDSANGESGRSLLRRLGDDAYVSDDDEDYVPPSERIENCAEVGDKCLAKNGKSSTVSIPRKEEIKISELESNNLDINICCVCLGDMTHEDDEIVTCDGCGVSVHEGCYGIPESDSLASTESSASTEPWFCDACKAGVQPHCELCPNVDGIFKETDSGKWVHIVCALYIPGVAFNDVDRLSGVTLFEMSYSKWGAKECSLCEDPRYSWTGVCICCDAGMCRNHFHATCAQREGLLSEASPEQDIADPFYAYCKQHAEKYSVKAKRKNYLATQSRMKSHQIENCGPPNEEKTRLQRKLQQHRKTYTENRVKRPPCWVPNEKLPRPLTSCPNAVRCLNRKAELLGVSTQHDGALAQRDVRKKSYVPAAFSMEFVGYYMDRNIKITQMRARNKEILSQNHKLIEQEAVHRAHYDRLHDQVAKLKADSAREQAQVLWDILVKLSDNKLALPDLLKTKSGPIKCNTTGGVSSGAGVGRGGASGPLSPPNTVIHKCGICLKTTSQHLLVRCDECHKRYHLACLDPPLTRMPKKTKLFGWQCMDCAELTSDEMDDGDGEGATSGDKPRRLRDKIKEPRKLLHENTTFGVYERPRKKTSSRRHDANRQRMSRRQASSSKKTENDAKRRRAPMMNYSAFGIGETRTLAPMECAMCLKAGSRNDMVRCDECTLCYHFLCLDPPQKKSPKRRGYNWLCDACDPQTKLKLETEAPKCVTPPVVPCVRQVVTVVSSIVATTSSKRTIKRSQKWNGSGDEATNSVKSAHDNPQHHATATATAPTTAKRARKYSDTDRRPNMTSTQSETPAELKNEIAEKVDNVSADAKAERRQKARCKFEENDVSLRQRKRTATGDCNGKKSPARDSRLESPDKMDEKLTKGKVLISRVDTNRISKCKVDAKKDAKTVVGGKKVKMEIDSDESRDSPNLMKSRDALANLLLKKEVEVNRSNLKGKTPKKTCKK